MINVRDITKLTDEKFVNLYDVHGVNSKGYESHYNVASRADSIEKLKISTRKNTPDGVIIYALYGERKDQVVIIRQYRYPIDDYVYELPAGLVEPGEDMKQAAIRELHEETGLVFHPIECDKMFTQSRFTTVGLTDESVGIIYGYAEGELSNRYTEKSEEIQVMTADRTQIRRILREELVAMPFAFQLMHFIADPEPFGFLFSAL
ncbi:MAG: NUDIX hydrolase [Lachnospiraceae bacterium]|nr:NUDIX hydrolase [Lachnospiraceae bacterium]